LIMGNAETAAEQREILLPLVVTFSVLGLIGALFIILSFIFIKELRTFVGIVVFNISLADSINIIGFLLSPGNTNVNVCNLQGFILQSGSLASILWDACLSITIYTLAVKLDRNPTYLLKYFIGVCWTFPFIFAIYMISTNGYANTGPWCWISSTREVERFLLYYNFVFLDFIIACITLVIVWQRVRAIAIEAGRSNSTVKNLTTVIATKARKYIFVFLFSYTATILVRIENAANPNITIFWLVCLQSTTVPFRGLLNGLAFGSNNYRKIYSVIVNKINRRKESKIEPISAYSVELNNVETSNEEDVNA